MLSASFHLGICLPIFLLLPTCCILATDLPEPDRETVNARKFSQYHKKRALDNSLPYLFLATNYELSLAMMSRMHNTESDHIPPKRLYEIFGELVQPENSAKVEQKKIVQDLWDEGSSSQPIGKYLPSIVLPYENHREFLTTGNPPDSLKDTTDDVGKFAVKMTEVSKEGHFGKLLIMNMNAYEVYFALAPTFPLLGMLNRLARFHSILEAHPIFQNLDGPSKMTVLEAFSSLPTKTDINVGEIDGKSLEAIKKKFMDGKVWKEPSKSSYDERKWYLQKHFEELPDIYDYEKLFLKKSQRIATREKTFDEYINKAQLHRDIIEQRLHQAKLTPESTQELIKLYKFEVQFTSVVDGFQYMKPGLKHVLDMYEKEGVISSKKKDNLINMFKINEPPETVKSVDDSMNRKIRPVHPHTSKNSLKKRVKNALGHAPDQPEYSKELMDKHFQIYKERLAYQKEVGNFVKFTQEETSTRKELLKQIRTHEQKFRDRKGHDKNAKSNFVYTIPCTIRQKRSLDVASCSCALCAYGAADSEEVTGRKGKTSAKETAIVEVNSKKVLEAYMDSSPPERQLLMDIVEANKNLIVGDPTDMQKVHNLIDYEKLHDHSNRLKFAQDVSSSNKEFSADIAPSDGRFLNSKENLHVSFSKMTETFNKLTGAANRGGVVMLGSSLSRAFAAGDTRSLAIIGGRVGGEASLSLLEPLGQNFVGKFGGKFGAKAAGSTLAVIGKAAGPLGEVADIGLSTWALYEAAKRLNDPSSTKFDQKDAISDIVESAVSTAVSAGTIGLLIAFPPAAPLIVAVSFFVNLFMGYSFSAIQASNHIQRLESQISLHGSEKSQEWIRNFLGEGTSDYLQGLIIAKTANHEILRQSVQLLEEREEIFGKIMNASTSKEVVTGKNRKQRISLCTSSEFLFCPFMQDSDRSTKWVTESSLNSYVDLRHPTHYYRDRSSPEADAVSSDFKITCFPGSIINHGKKISVQNKNYGYLCEHAIGVERKTRTSTSKYMYIQLGNGNDTVYSNDNQDVFIVNDGYKYFNGAGGDDFFNIVTCKGLHGVLDGQEGTDSVRFEEGCPMRDNAPVKLMLSPFSRTYNVRGPVGNFYLQNVETIYGSKTSVEEIYGAQELDYVELGGTASSYLFDLIEINGPSQVANKDILVRIGNSTRVRLTSFGTGTVNMYVPNTYKQDFEFHLSSKINSYTIAKASISLEFDDLTQVIIVSVKTRAGFGLAHSNIRLVFNAGRIIELDLKVRKTPSMMEQLYNNFNVGMFNDLKQTKSLKVNLVKKSILEVNHYLNSTTENIGLISGVENSQNYFYLIEGSWRVNGIGNDTFNLVIGRRLRGTYVTRGGKLRIHSPHPVFRYFDLIFTFTTGVFQGPFGTLLTFKGITEFVGVSGIAEHVYCNCETNLVQGEGGSPSTPDTIYYNSTCHNKTPLTVIAKGNTHVYLSSSNLGNRSVIVHVDFHQDTHEKSQILFHQKVITTGSLGTGRAQVMLPIPTSAVQSAKLCSNSQAPICFKLLTSNSNWMQFKITGTERDSASHFGHTEYLDTKTDILFAPSDSTAAFVLIRRDNLQPEIVHEVNAENRKNSTILSAVGNLTNIFLCRAGIWNVFGSDKDDQFIILSTQFSGTLNGGGGKNVLIIDSSINTSDEIQIDFGDEGYLTTSRNSTFVCLQNIGSLIGRPNHPEKVIVKDSNVQFINTNGGNEISMDNVIVAENMKSDQMNLTIVVNAYTILTNRAERGHFLYVVQGNSNVYLNWSLSRYSEAAHILKIQEACSKLYQVSYAKDLNILTLNFRDNHLDVPYKFDDDRRVVVQFAEGTSVNCDVSVLEHADIQVLIRPPSGQLNVTCVRGARNVVYIDASELCLSAVVGAEKDDVFVVSKDACIDHLHGGLPDSLNTLKISDFNTTNHEEVIVILLSNTNSSATIRKSGQLRTLIKKIEHIRIFNGPTGAQSQVHIGCDTYQVKNAAHVYVTDFGCRTYDVDIWIQPETRVIFQAFPPTNVLSPDDRSSLAGTVRYHFETLQSFDASTDLYSEILGIKHVFHLPIQAKAIDRIELQDMSLKYTVGNETHSHQIYDLYYINQHTETNFQFFSNPRLVLADGFNIQIDPFGKVFFILIDPNAEHHSTTEQFIEMYTPLAAKLQVNIMMQLFSDFIYFASPSTSKLIENEDQRANDVVSNYAPLRSHLVGAGGGTVVYMIVDLKKDVHIHPFFKNSNLEDQEAQVIDLTNLMATLENQKFSSKYIPSVTQDGKSLVITMKGYESEFPANVVIHNAMSQPDALRVRLRVYLMRFKCDQQDEWSLKPIAMTIPEGIIAGISAQDLEVGQKFFFAPTKDSTMKARGREKRASDGSQIDETGDPRIARNGNNLIFTTLSSFGSEKGSTLVLLDIMKVHRIQNEGVHGYNNVQIAGSNTTWTLMGLNVSESKNGVAFENLLDIQSTTSWSQILEEMEDEILSSIPEIPRCFQQKSIWFQLVYWGSVTILLGLLIIVVVLVLVVYYRMRRRSWNIKQLEAAPETAELITVEKIEGTVSIHKTVGPFVDSTAVDGV